MSQTQSQAPTTSDNSHQALLDALQTFVVILDTAGTVLFANKAALTMTGLRLDNLRDKKLWDCFWFNFKPETQARIQSYVYRAVAGEQIREKIQVKTSDGLLGIELKIQPVMEQGRVFQLVAEGGDITEQRQRHNKKNRLSQQRLQRLFDDMQTMVGLYDPDGTTTFLNNTPLLATGFTMADAIGKKLWETPFFNYSNEAMAQVRQQMHRTALGTSTLADIKIMTRSGDMLWSALSFHPVYDDNGRVVQIVGEARDITSEHAARKALLNSEKIQREILDSMVEGIVVTDQSGAILSLNLATEKLLSYDSNELIGQHICRLIKGYTRQDFDKNMQAYIETGDIRHIGMSIEINVLSKNGDTFPTVLAVAELSRTEAGKRRFISSFRDLSDSKKQEEQLRRSQKMDALGKLTGGIAHDFNNMLGIVTGYAELMEGALTGQDKLLQYAHEIHRAGERGAKLTRKLLSFSQQTATSAAPLDINTLINHQRHMLETSLTPRINLVYELGENIWPICLDSDDLEDAIINICINAMHAIEANGQVTVRTENIALSSVNAQQKNLPRGDYVLLSIRDTGKGMDEATKQQIFDPFYTTKGEQGTGLGLSQVYGFVERSKGAIDVSSTPGQGTQLRIYFPRDKNQAADDNCDDTAAHERLRGHETILVVDDEVKLLDLCIAILEQQGYRVLPASNGREALQLLEAHSVDLMFSDVVMPDMDGYELALIVAQKYPAIKIQMTSGFTDDRQNALGDDSLHQNLLVKPYHAQTLLARIRARLDKQT